MSERVAIAVRDVRELREGDIVRNLGSGHGYIVMANYGTYAIAAKTVHISNPSEWLVLREVEPPKDRA